MRMLATLCLFASSLYGADVTGKWEAMAETTAGSGSPSFVFKQDGEKLTGDYSGALGQAKLTGTVKGDAIEFSLEAGEGVKVVYTGTIKSATSMSGKLDMGGLGEGTWTATKK